MKNKSLLVLLISLSFAASAFAAGVANNTIGIQESERCSFIGIANDSSSVAHNPAGLTNIAAGKIDAEIGTLYNWTNFTYEDTAGKEHASKEPVFLPAVFAAMSLGDIAFGLGLYVPNGSGTMKFEDVPLSDDSLGMPLDIKLDIKGETYSVVLGTGAAYKIMPNLSIGLTLEYFYGRSSSKKNIDTITIPNGNIKIDEKISGFGGIDAKLGLFAKVTEALNAGLLVKTPAKLKTKGTRDKDYNDVIIIAAGGMGLTLSDTHEDVKIEETIPWYFMAGIGYKILPNLDASLDVGYKLWSKYKKVVKVEGVKEDLSSVDKDTLKDSYQIGGGVKYGVLPVLDLIAGILYVPTAKKDKDVSLGETDFDQTLTSFSMAYKAIQGIELHFGVAYVKSLEKRDVPAGGKVDSNTFYIQGGVRGVF